MSDPRKNPNDPGREQSPHKNPGKPQDPKW